ncbi:uncharacterized protein [Watersipora subatra]|uniref:uncharacterized protein n=1 Tax=Watersipora subatra TaxID=2589382 RepID=UPI00355B53EF
MASSSKDSDHLNGVGEVETDIPRGDMMIDLAKILDGIHLQGQINAMESKESKVEDSKEEIQPETSVVRVVPSRDARCEESKVEEPKEEVQLESSGKSANDDQLAGSEPKVQIGNDNQPAGSEPKVQNGNDDQLAGSEPKVSDNPVAMEEELEKADWYGDIASMEEGDLLNEDEVD